MKQRLMVGIILVFGLFVANLATIGQSQNEDICTPEVIEQNLLAFREINQRFENADRAASQDRYAAVSGRPRLRLIVATQEIRAELEAIGFPQCMRDFYASVLGWWNRRIDHLTYAMGEGSEANSISATQQYFQLNVLPEILELEALADIDYFSIMGQERPQLIIEGVEITPSNIINPSQGSGEIERNEVVFDVSLFSIPNCESETILSINDLPPVTRNRERQVSLNLNQFSETNLRVSSVSEVTNYILTYFRIDSNVPPLSDTVEVTFSVEPGTIKSYEIIWIEIQSEYLLELVVDDDAYFIPFTISEEIRGELRESSEVTCPLNTATPTATSVPPTPTTVEVGQIFLINPTYREVLVDFDDVPMDNCEGSETVSTEYTVTESFQIQTELSINNQLDTQGQLNLFGLVKANVENQLNLQYNSRETEGGTIQTRRTISALPRENIIHEFTTTQVQSLFMIEVLENGRPNFLNVVTPTRQRVSYNARRIPCSETTAIPIPTPTP
ncbi:MAG: hypothetical protein SF029_01865 [bacterium]|nr:hypothetical protein [bacterium]